MTYLCFMFVAGKLTSTGSSTVYAELPQNLSATMADLSAVMEKAASGMSLMD